MTNLNFADPEYSGERFRHWFAYMIEASDMTIHEVAEELGYSRPNTVQMWLDGKAKPSWEHIPALAKLLVIDPAVLIPLFIEMDIDDKDKREEIFKASCRICPEWEYPLHVLARNIYLTGEESIWTHMPDYMS
ncbi:helix-turn-helix domain-containing protein [Henriciella mobilis]|uniref:XRE family transcriptional regulator n=1 Tax=Henriciella mobilis TaxID=2305467 RepID=A0A399RJ90_9PROT|nr:helix-turn-helix transcriptional regulator [Henriciella mobilis]RIJ29789.1 XRE family transcriptional regulator [Henriciella mobilis]